jgi:hypothetical protein
MPDQSIYQQLVAAGCTIDNHESDLYVRATKEAVAILRANKVKCSLFISPADEELWAELPFAFDPFWAKRA